MEIYGKIIKLLPLQSGTGKNGPWKKQEFILETTAQVRRKVCFSMWGDKIDQFALKEGEDVEVSFDIESREFNNRWYTEAKAWKVVKKTQDIRKPPEDEEEFPVYDALPPDDGLPF